MDDDGTALNLKVEPVPGIEVTMKFSNIVIGIARLRQ